MPARLVNAHMMGPPWQHLTCWCTQRTHECLPLSQEDECCGKSDYHQDEVCLIATNATGWWLFTSYACRSWWGCECLLFSCCWETGTLLPGHRPATLDLWKHFPGRRGGCVACAQTAAQYTEVAMAVLCKYTLHNGAATCHHTGSGPVAYTEGSLPPWELCSRTNTRTEYLSIHRSLLKSIVRLHLTVELGLEHLGNNLHIMSTTASLPLPFPLSTLQGRPSWLHSILHSKTCLSCVFLSSSNSFNSGTLTPTPSSAAGALANKKCSRGTPSPWKPASGLKKSIWVPVWHWKARNSWAEHLSRPDCFHVERNQPRSDLESLSEQINKLGYCICII